MYHPDSVVKLHEKILKDANLEHIRFHDLRHTFATLALQNGVDVKTVSTVFGLGKNKKDGSRYIYFDYEPWPNAQGIKFHKAATYPEIKAWVLREYGLSVTDRHIAYVKRKHGIIMLVNQRGPLPENVNIPLEKETAIEAAFRHFGMI